MGNTKITFTNGKEQIVPLTVCYVFAGLYQIFASLVSVKTDKLGAVDIFFP